MRRDSLYTALALAVLVLAVMPVGAAVFVLGFLHGDSPCVMCWEQRIGMALIALLGIFVLRYGPRPRYLGLAVLIGAYGIFMGLRHVASHAARDIGQGFSIPILGAHTYTWSLFIFWVSVVTMGVLLMLIRKEHLDEGSRSLRPLERLAGAVFLVVIGANAVQAFASTGPPPFMGQPDPVRFSFNPRHWVWSLDEWHAVPISWRGRWSVERPAAMAIESDPATGPLADLPSLPILERRALALTLDGAPSDLAYDAATDQFVLTTRHGVYVTDGALGRVVRHTVVDPGFSVDLGEFAGVAFLDSARVMALGENKSFVILAPSDSAGANANFRFFLDAADQFSEVARSRFGTVRARMMYVQSLAYDPATRSIFTVSVPNSKTRRLVVSRFDRGDLTLSEEYVPALAPSSGLRLGEKRTVHEYLVTAATVSDGRLYTLSAAHRTLLEIDLSTRSIIGAYTLPGLDHPTGLAVKGDAFYVVDAANTLTLVARHRE